MMAHNIFLQELDGVVVFTLVIGLYLLYFFCTLALPSLLCAIFGW